MKWIIKMMLEGIKKDPAVKGSAYFESPKSVAISLTLAPAASAA